MTGKNDGTGEGLLAFLEWVKRTGQMNSSTAGAWAATAAKVLEVEGDPGAVDMRSLDVDELLERFNNLHRLDYSPGSMSTYKSRFRQATTAYLAWLNNEPWKPAGRNGKQKTAKSATPTKAVVGPEPAESAPSPSTPVARLVNYSVPLRPDLMVNLSLPADLTTADADRIANFVRSLAFDDVPRSTAAGSSTAGG